MINIFRSLNFERLSFWIGFVAATIFWWLAVTLRPHAVKLFHSLKDSFQSAKKGLQAGIEDRHLTDTIKYAQSLHLAAPLFSLDEILIPPRLLTLPHPVEPGKEPPHEDIVAQTIPFMPDRPELASAFGAHTISLEEALQGGQNIVLVGPPGSGKSVALADFAVQIARNQVRSEHLADFVPILLHAADLNLPTSQEDPLESLINALSLQASALSAPRLPKFIQEAFDSGYALLLLDGLDELAPEPLAKVVDYLQLLLTEFPQNKIVVTANPRLNGGLPKLGFAVLPMAAWGARQQLQFSKTWGEMWSRFIDKESHDDYISVHPLLLNGWLLNQHSAITPLEFTLQIWAAYAGDVRGPRLSDAIEAYVRRMSVGIPKAHVALERLSSQAVLRCKSSFTESEANLWLSEVDGLNPADYTDDSDRPDESEHGAEITVPRILPDLADVGLLVYRNDDRFSFAHPMIQSFVAGHAFASALNEDLYSQPAWLLRDLTIQFVATQRDLSDQADQLFSQPEKVLYRQSIFVTEWLPDIPLNSVWRKRILGVLSGLLSNEELPLGARARLMTNLARTKDPDISTLFRHMLKSAKTSVRHLAALGSGFHRDTQAVDVLIQLLNDQPSVSRAASLALVNIGTQPALEAIASALLQGSEDVRHAAAEAFANHPEEGYPTLREATSIDDLLVRRAAITGLRRIREDWAIQLLEEMQIEDAQWVVKNAAAQAMEDINNATFHIPKTPLPLPELPWLISFAAERGVGVSPGEPALKMLIQVLQQGNEDEQMAALFQIHMRGIARVFPAIFDQYCGSDIELREMAYNTIWQLAANGEDIPSTVQYGMV
ncbi:MAG: HEAT repeat domain-containing protein [Anaerolineales bacterium]|nr:HEAT repeat domain-containing protein [Chloroflexota bacterium]MBL6982393.1 HEAT repeat domain-containing protein [Anaerolineales bacterium]